MTSCTVIQEVRANKQKTIWTYFDYLDTLDVLYKKHLDFCLS